MPAEEKMKNSVYYTFGHDTFGPFLFGFTRWLKEHIDGKQYKKVFFFSRDGYLMKKAFDIVDANKNVTEYVYFSRKSLRQALLWRTTSFEESLKYLAWERYISFGKLLEYLGFDEKERQCIAEENKLDLNRDMAYEEIKKDSEAKHIYSLYKEVIVEKSKEQSELLLRYLTQIDMHGHVAIIDIGWHGSMQYYLELFLAEHCINAEIDGYYVGIMPNIPLKSNTFGYVYDEKKPQKRKETLCSFGVFERLFQGFEGSTNGYKYTSNEKVGPDLAKYEYESKDDLPLVNRIKEWQQAALEYVTENKNNLSNLDHEKLIQPIIHFGKSPTLKDTNVFRGFYTYDGSKRYFICNKKLFEYTPKAFIHDLSNSQWKTGFLKSAFKIPFPYYKIYEVIRK